LKESFGWTFHYCSKRMPILASNVMATSQPLACQAGLEMLKKGGNAVDAAIAAAITLTVVEPVNNGIGSDAFAIVWDGKKLHGLNASGRSPATWNLELFSKYKRMPIVGWESVTTPGAVSAWVELSNKFGSLEFEELFQPAIKYARSGFLVSPITAEAWKLLIKMYPRKKFPEFHATFTINGKAPLPGSLFKNPSQANTLELIANSEGEEFYKGKIAKKIVKYSQDTGGYFSIEDFENHSPEWVELLSINYKGITIHEMPPNTQGSATLIALGILKNFDLQNLDVNSPESMHLQLEAMKLAIADTAQHVGDPVHMKIAPEALLNDKYLESRASLINLQEASDFKLTASNLDDTVYLTTADENGMMVSYIQSNYMGFGSGIIVPNTGISFQNRGCGFNLIENHPNVIGPSKRPFHTIIPAFVTKNNEPLMSFGVMGGPMQPQGHLQMIMRIFEFGENPQAAIDAPRWRVMDGLNIKVEKGFDENTMSKLKKMGHIVKSGPYVEFGGAQIIYKLDDGYLAASDPRKDGQAVGF